MVEGIDKEIQNMCLAGMTLECLYEVFSGVSTERIGKIYKFVCHKQEKPYMCYKDNYFDSDMVLTIGERICQEKYGSGVVDDVEYDSSGKAYQFSVIFDDGKTFSFRYPIAFQSNTMKLVDQTTDIQAIEEKYRVYAGNSYNSWERLYPNYVVIKKEGYFWTCRGESAKRIHEIMNYKLVGAKTGSPYLDRMVNALKIRKINYIVIDGSRAIDKGEFNQEGK